MMNANALAELEKKLAAKVQGANSEALKAYSLFLDKFRASDPKTGEVHIDLKRLKDTFGGIGGRLYVFGTGKFGEVMNTYDPDLRLFEAILEKKVIYVALPTMGNNEGAINMGKMFIGDLRTAIAWVQDLPEAKRPDPSFLVLMDEMGSYAVESLARPYEQARSARLTLCGMVQTVANLDAVSDEFREIVLGNTWTKVFFKIASQKTAVEFADLIDKEVKITRSLSDTSTASSSAQFLRHTPESANSSSEGTAFGEREQEAYRVSPADLKALNKGECVVTYGGNRLFSLNIPRILVGEDAQEKFGKPLVTRRVPRDVPGANFFANAERYLNH
jgi:intracellular multiplication protein IcmO